ncbi:hypothetical protein KP509_32G063000 [Ceratopteris richardii]|nr:hypothetical protein KP509_32G063000 [Ceratopteris richardii]
MTGALLNMLSIESPSTVLSIDSSIHEEGIVPRLYPPGLSSCPPDINLPLSSPEAVAPLSWLSSPESLELIDVNLAKQNADPRAFVSSKGKRSSKRSDSIWGAWFFFSHYFRPSQPDKTGLKLDQFIVQHDMENMYMWAFRKRPENALGKMQLRSYMNGHARFGEPQFPFSAQKGFMRSHRMQRKYYRGLSNPQCVHGLELVRNPDISHVSKEDQSKWMELTGRQSNFTLPLEASDFVEWRTVPCTDIDSCERSGSPNGSSKKRASSKSVELGGSVLDLSCKLMGSADISNIASLKKRHKCDTPSSNEEECCVPNNSHSGEIFAEEFQQCEQPHWLAYSSGVIVDGSGPVVGAKTIYEDDEGYLIMVSLPFTDLSKLRVSWRNTAAHGVVKVHCHSTARMPVVMRGERTFRLSDPSPEHCPQGEFIREISLATRIPDDAELKAFYVEASAGLEITVPKHTQVSEEREVRVFLPPQLGKA